MSKFVLATFESLTRPGTLYEYIYDQDKKSLKCSCPGARHHGHCKHIPLFKSGVYPKTHVRLTIFGAIKFPNLSRIYQTAM